MYTFTRPGNAAHPSFARSVFGQRQGKVFIETTGATAGDRAAFEKWFAGFLARRRENPCEAEPEITCRLIRVAGERSIDEQPNEQAMATQVLSGRHARGSELGAD
jgi:hypothetical protein